MCCSIEEIWRFILFKFWCVLTSALAVMLVVVMVLVVLDFLALAVMWDYAELQRCCYNVEYFFIFSSS